VSDRSLSPGGTQPPIRRSHERHQTRVNALIHCHGRFQTVRIIDFSLGGLQLQGCFGVGVADAIAVELLSGHSFRAKVTWSIGDRVGVRFAEALLSDDPALEVLRRGMRRAIELAPGDPISEAE
jgi:hypothetical protein